MSPHMHPPDVLFMQSPVPVVLLVVLFLEQRKLTTSMLNEDQPVITMGPKARDQRLAAKLVRGLS